MSKLYFNECGHVVPTLCEELTTFRRARKVLTLPATSGSAALYFLAQPHEGSKAPLRLSVNGTELPPVAPGQTRSYFWYQVALPPTLLKPGANTFELWTDATAMNAWSLALEAGHAQPQSFLSDDGGKTWRNEHMGYLNVLRAEYVLRVRLIEGEDPDPPAMVWEGRSHPRAESLRHIIPSAALGKGPLLNRVRVLTGWLSTSWTHTGSHMATQYAPWDAETILAWGRSRRGHYGQLPIVMCVHYGAAFASCAQAAGIPARCAATMNAADGFAGHFVNEVWFDEHRKWVMVDPNADAILWKDGVPLSIGDIQKAGSDLGKWIEWGTGAEFQRQNPMMVSFIRDNYERGLCFRHRSVWSRGDFLSHPELTPPGHGSTAYCETGLVWETRDRDCGFGMFPYFGDSDYFDAPPQFQV